MNERARRQSFLGEGSEDIFAHAVVAIIGLCGGGSHVAQQLALAGFRRFRLFDPDHVTEPNLNRMVGSRPRDAARRRLKTHVIRDLILQVQPGAEIEILHGTWQESHIILRNCSLVLGCLDSFGQRDELEGYC